MIIDHTADNFRCCSVQCHVIFDLAQPVSLDTFHIRDKSFIMENRCNQVIVTVLNIVCDVNAPKLY